jgi:hypothetical protein
MHWENSELAKEASKNFMKSDLTQEFRNSLVPTSVKLRFFEQCCKWGKV